MNTAIATNLIWEEEPRYRQSSAGYPDAIIVVQNMMANNRRHNLVQALRGIHGVYDVRFSRRLSSAIRVRFDRRLVEVRSLIECAHKLGAKPLLIECY